MNRMTTHRGSVLVRRPFCDEEPMVGPPDCSEAAFKRPLLRRCPFDLGAASWIAPLGGGLDGYAWKVMFGDQGPFVIKVFWNTEPPKNYYLYYAAQREGQNAALLEKMAAAVGNDTETRPIRVHARLSTYEDAMDNLLAFSTEGREKQYVEDADAVTVSSIPRFKKCFGWLKIDGEYLCSLPRGLRPPVVRLPKFGDRQVFPDRQHFAIVYDYIPEGDNDTGQMQLVLDFLWRAGFDFSQSLRKENWKSGVLVDLADFIYPLGYCWHPNRNRGSVDASRAFLPPPSPPPSPPPPAPLSDSDASSSASPSPSATSSDAGEYCD